MVHLKYILKPLCWDNFRSSSGSETIQKCPLSILSRRTRSCTSFLVWGVLVLPLQIQEDLVAGYIQIQDWAVLGMVHSRRVRAPHYSLRRQQKTERGEIAFHCHLNQQFVWNLNKHLSKSVNDTCNVHSNVSHSLIWSKWPEASGVVMWSLFMETSIIKLPLDNPAYLQYRSHCRGISYLNISSQEFVLVKIADMFSQQMKLLSMKHVGNHQTALNVSHVIQ